MEPLNLATYHLSESKFTRAFSVDLVSILPADANDEELDDAVLEVRRVRDQLKQAVFQILLDGEGRRLARTGTLTGRVFVRKEGEETRVETQVVVCPVNGELVEGVRETALEVFQDLGWDAVRVTA